MQPLALGSNPPSRPPAVCPDRVRDKTEKRHEREQSKSDIERRTYQHHHPRRLPHRDAQSSAEQRARNRDPRHANARRLLANSPGAAGRGTAARERPPPAAARVAHPTHRQASLHRLELFGVAVTVPFMAILNAGAGFVLLMAIDAAQRVSVESRGKIVVDGRFDQAVENIEAVRTRQLRDDVQAHGAADLVPARPATPGIKAMARTGPVPMMFGLCRQHSGR
jgi:hypothetical protein